MIQLSVEEKKEKNECDKLKNEFASLIKGAKEETGQEGSLTMTEKRSKINSSRLPMKENDHSGNSTTSFLSNSGTSIDLRNLGGRYISLELC